MIMLNKDKNDYQKSLEHSSKKQQKCFRTAVISATIITFATITTF